MQFKKKNHIGERIIANNHVLFTLENSKLWLFTMSSSEVWQLLDTCADTDQLYQAIAQRNNCPVEQVAEPVEQFLRVLSQCDLLELYENGVLIADTKLTTSMEKQYDSLCVKNKIPKHVLFELTYNCNLNCRHCYIYHRYSGLPQVKIQQILYQLREAGTIDITFSGGEIFLRNDIFDILEFAIQMGFRTTIITNGTLLDTEMITQLSKLPLAYIKTSIYSLRPHIHDLITGVPGSHQATLNSIAALAQTGKKVGAGAIVQEENAPDIPQLKAYIESLGCIFAGDYNIFPDHQGSHNPLRYRVSEELLTTLFRKKVVTPSREVSCEAGIIKAKIDPKGNVYPCELLNIPIGNLYEQSFAEIWGGQIAEEIRVQVNNYNPPECEDCSLRACCIRCPAYVWTSDNYPNIHHNIMCFTARCHQNSLKEA